jgi:hypothetical protein
VVLQVGQGLAAVVGPEAQDLGADVRLVVADDEELHAVAGREDHGLGHGALVADQARGHGVAVAQGEAFADVDACGLVIESDEIDFLIHVRLRSFLVITGGNCGAWAAGS